jgi:hypothetical protein
MATATNPGLASGENASPLDLAPFAAEVVNSGHNERFFLDQRYMELEYQSPAELIATVKGSLPSTATPEEVSQALASEASDVSALYQKFRLLPAEEQPADLYRLIGLQQQLLSEAGIRNEIPDDLKEVAARAAMQTPGEGQTERRNDLAEEVIRLVSRSEWISDGIYEMRIVTGERDGNFYGGVEISRQGGEPHTEWGAANETKEAARQDASARCAKLSELHGDEAMAREEAEIQEFMRRENLHGFQATETPKPIESSLGARVDAVHKATWDAAVRNGGGEPVDAPPRRSEIERTPALKQAYEEGRQSVRVRLDPKTPQTSEELRNQASVEMRNAGGYATIHVRNTGGGYREEVAFRMGSRSETSAWYRERKPGVKLVEELTGYANKQEALPYVQAESHMAQSMAQQIASGSKSIDLSQRYATGDQSAAKERHEKAVQNLMPLLREAARNGYTITYGQAIAQGFRQKEVLAISNGYGMSQGGA